MRGIERVFALGPGHADNRRHRNGDHTDDDSTEHLSAEQPLHLCLLSRCNRPAA
jgi:hypothetical protein